MLNWADILGWMSTFFMYVLLITCLAPGTLRLFQRQGWTTFNYQHKEVVQSFGLLFTIHYGIFMLITWCTKQGLRLFGQAWEGGSGIYGKEVFFILLVLSMVGWLDDRYGSKHIKGFRGHFSMLLKRGLITTGLIKAATGLLLGMSLALGRSEDVLTFVVHVSIFVLAVHIVNLLDVRPGRALKFYWVFSLLLVLFLEVAIIFNVVLPMAFSTFILFHYDRQRLVMLGDAGSLSLGGVLGYLYMNTVQSEPVFISFLLFFLLSLAAEKISLSTLIKKIPWLSKLDQWGIR